MNLMSLEKALNPEMTDDYFYQGQNNTSVMSSVKATDSENHQGLSKFNMSGMLIKQAEME